MGYIYYIEIELRKSNDKEIVKYKSTLEKPLPTLLPPVLKYKGQTYRKIDLRISGGPSFTPLSAQYIYELVSEPIFNLDSYIDEDLL